MKNLILIAPPAAGKGTLTQLLMNRLGYVSLSTGDMFRELALSDPRISQQMKNGKLIDDTLVFEIVEDAILKLKGKPYILDGFPRTINQACFYQKFLEEQNIPLGAVVYLDVPKEELERRVCSRMVCPCCKAVYSTINEKFFPKKEGICDYCHHTLVKRADDEKAIFNKRYDEYIKNTKPLLDHYRKIGNISILTTTDIDEMYGLILQLLGVD